ncbi:ATP-dependent RNA helicase vasa isoform X2 [Sitodiplosis mosellana]|uniref:ATP-dependent RNA helicase vasa isoform X2 n=1 Tax=Sitodiplosis mosellana TaxID=263140 RepID=UPI00244531B9|nr:ATP-dependent RNA helicase vasa isoform X2 [Sitodiplosis mosellana]
MADEWDDDFAPAAKPISVNTKKFAANNNDEWNDDPPQKPANKQNQGGWSGGNNNNAKKANDDGWDDDPKPTNNRSTNNGWSGGNVSKKADDGWDDEPSTNNKSNGWNGGGGGSKNDDGWGDDSSSNKKPFANRSNNDRGGRKPDWICNGCGKTVFGSRDECYACHEPKGDAKDAPADGGRPKRANDWICDGCGAKVFGSKTSCFKCQADKGDSKDAPPDDGNSSSRGGRPNDWICDSCGAKVFGSKSTCFKCQADKGDSKDAPPDDGNSSSRGGRPNDWICDSCGAKVFGSKTTCFKCQADKGDSKDAPADDGGNSFRSNNRDGGDGGSRPGPGGKPGDWTCACGVSNYASRNECFKCQEPKPEGAGGDAKFNSEAPKEFYIPTEIQEDDLFTAGISTGINFTKYKDIPVKVTDNARNSPPKPCSTFKDGGLNDFLLTNIEKSGYKTPTPIQQHAIPIVKAKRDLMACAQTGSGKTAAFLLPMIQTLMEENAPLNIGKPYVVIVTPTRELCTQIYNEARKFAQGSIIKCCQIYGGTAARHQSSNINNGCHILVATPGRLKHFCEQTFVTFENLRYFVLDEADRMLDMGFAPHVEEIMKNPTMVATGTRQTLMFSATFPEDIQRMAGQYLHEYIFLTIGVVGGACQDVKQNVLATTKFDKRNKLMELLNAEDPIGTMVFVETKRTADFLASFLSESEHRTTSIHGDRTQKQREEALADFKAGRMKVIIATSVAARGLDIPKVRHVINYDIPKGIDDYVHRIGRTGRVGNTGKATSFFDAEQDADIVSDLVRILKEANQEIPDFLANGGSGGGGGSGGNSRSNFGGTDFRNNGSSAAPAAHGGGGDDEEW